MSCPHCQNIGPRLDFIPGEYSMTQEEQDAIFGRLSREKKETESRLKALRDKAERFGTMFVQIGQMLRETPECVVFNQVPGPLEFRRPNAPVFHPENINAEMLTQLVKDIQDTLLKLRSIKEKLA